MNRTWIFRAIKDVYPSVRFFQSEMGTDSFIVQIPGGKGGDIVVRDADVESLGLGSVVEMVTDISEGKSQMVPKRVSTLQFRADDMGGLSPKDDEVTTYGDAVGMDGFQPGIDEEDGKI